MPSIKERHSSKHSEVHEDEHSHEEVASAHESGSGTGSEGSEGEEEEEEDDEEEGSEVNIDLSDNEFYKGMCTLLEDDNGNNIVRYIDLLCEHTKEISDSVKHIESMRNDIHRIAKSFEKLVTLQEQFMGKQMVGGSAVMPPPAPKKEHHSSEATREATRVDDATVKSSKKSSEATRDDATVKSSKTQKSTKH